MNGYFHSIIVISSVAQLIMMTLPDKDQQTYKKTMRLLCGVVLLAVITAPLNGIFQTIHTGYLDKIELIPEEYPETSAENTEKLKKNMWETVLRETAKDWIMYLENNYDVESKFVNIVFVTDDETYSIKEIQVFIEKCPYTLRQNIESDLKKKMEPMVVSVFGE